jgi:hypothetical protein
MWYDGKPIEFLKEKNEFILHRLRQYRNSNPTDLYLIEMIQSFGLPVGKEVFETCVWIGRFTEALYPCRVEFVYRIEEKLYLCHTTRANDSTIRQALIDRYGSTREEAIGKNASKGPLHGLKGDCWSALAIAVTGENKYVPKKQT